MITTASSLRCGLAASGVLAAVLLASAAADEPSPPMSRLLTASDLAQLTRGIALPAGTRFTLKVWAPARQVWTLRTEGAKLILTARNEGKDESPRWQVAGHAAADASGSVRIEIPAARSLEPAKAKTKADAKEKAKAKGKSAASKPDPLPALVAITTDPAYDPGAALELMRGRLDTVSPPADPRRTEVRTNQQGAEFHAPVSVQAWHERARAVREQLLVALGLWPMFPKTPMHPQVYGKLERDGYTIEKVVLGTLPGFTLSGNLYRPVGKTGKVPVVLCPHGHWADGRVNPELQQRCIRWAKLGCVVFLYDMVGYVDSKPFGHAFLNDRLRRWGLSLATLQTWNSIRALDWVTSLPDVDPSRVGCTGESGGGTQTFLLTAIDDRIKVAAPVVMVSDSFQGGCVCENAAGLRIGTDNVEFAALAAPRPMKLVGASGDWTAKTMTNAFPTLRSVYALTGVPDRLSADVFDFPHNYNQTTRNAVYAFMAYWLLGIDDSQNTREGPQTPEKPEDLRTFNAEHPAPVDRKTPAELEAELVRLADSQLDSLAPAGSAAAWEASRTLLATSLKVRTGIVNPTPAELAATTVRRATRDRLTVIHAHVGRRSLGERIPVVRLIPANATGRLTLVATPHGKQGLVTAAGKPTALVQALLDRGQSVVGFDPLLVGESLDPSAPARRRPDTVHFDTYNPALAADQMQDLATVLAWARAQPDVREVSVVGAGLAGAQVLVARPALQGLARTAIDLDNFDPGDGSSNLPAALDLPGLLQFGGVKSAAAQCAPAPLWIHRAPPAFDRSWPERAYTFAGADGALKVQAERAAASDLARWIDTGE